VEGLKLKKAFNLSQKRNKDRTILFDFFAVKSLFLKIEIFVWQNE
jgi:hypothetical protein